MKFKSSSTGLTIVLKNKIIRFQNGEYETSSPDEIKLLKTQPYVQEVSDGYIPLESGDKKGKGL